MFSYSRHDGVTPSLWIDDAECESDLVGEAWICRIDAWLSAVPLHPARGRLQAMFIRGCKFKQSSRFGGCKPNRTVAENQLCLSLRASRILGHLAYHGYQVPIGNAIFVRITSFNQVFRIGFVFLTPDDHNIIASQVSLSSEHPRELLP